MRSTWVTNDHSHSRYPKLAIIPRFTLKRALTLLPLWPAVFSPSIYTQRPFGGLSQIFRMAWRSGGASNRDLIENLWRNGLITDQRVKDAFLKVNLSHTHTRRLASYLLDERG